MAKPDMAVRVKFDLSELRYDKWITEMEEKAKLNRDYHPGDLDSEFLWYSSKEQLLWAGQYNAFTINQLESLLKHMKKYAK